MAGKWIINSPINKGEQKDEEQRFQGMAGVFRFLISSSNIKYLNLAPYNEEQIEFSEVALAGNYVRGLWEDTQVSWNCQNLKKAATVLIWEPETQYALAVPNEGLKSLSKSQTRKA